MSALGLAAVAASSVLSAQGGGEPRGHWTGSIQLPNNTTLGVVVDLDKTAQGWIGSMSIPEQKASGVTLTSIGSAEAGTWGFKIQGPAGDPAFVGKLAADGKSLNGQLTQGGQVMPMKLTHAGEPKVELPKLSPPLAKEFLGEWEGALEGPGLRLRLKLSNVEGSGAKGLLVSLDQGGAEIPASSIGQKGRQLSIEIKVVGGLYRGELNEEGTELKGDWSQGGNTLPLLFKKAPVKP